jgi:hypothetical protein
MKKKKEKRNASGQTLNNLKEESKNQETWCYI